MSAPITSLYAGLTALYIVALAFRVVRYRRALRVGLGDNDSRDLQVAIRAHGNTIEYAPIFFILLLLAETGGASTVWLHLLGIMFLIARFAHTMGFTKAAGGYSSLRVYGIVLTWAAIALLAAMNIGRYVTATI